jgi:hypothetical protein
VNGWDPSGCDRLLNVIIAFAIVGIILSAIIPAGGKVLGRLFGSWGVIGKPPKTRHIAIIVGDMGYGVTYGEALSMFSIGKLVSELSKAGHDVELIRNPDEEGFIKALNEHDLVGIYAHGFDQYSQGEAPVAGFGLGGTSHHPDDQGVILSMGDPRSVNVPDYFITNNELYGQNRVSQITNKNLEVAAASCNSGTTSCLVNAMGNPTSFIGMKGAQNIVAAKAILRYIVERANGNSMVNAQSAVQALSGKVVVDPSNNTY